MDLDYTTLHQLRRQHPAWRLLVAEHAPLVASFLHRVFIAPNVRSMAQANLVEALNDTLYDLREHLGEQAFPRPALDIYLRQMDLPGVDTKFTETHRGVLTELLDLALPSHAVDAAATGVGQFARRYGFFDKPLRIRLRWLGAAALTPWAPGITDIAITQAAFEALNPPVRRVFITENEVNFLALPPVTDSLVVFGAGYGFDVLAGAAWLQQCAVHYWGDIDTHGFAILDQLRTTLPQAHSLLMDRATLLAHADHWGNEPQPLARELPRLHPHEAALYDDLRYGRVRAEPLRLEQERIGFGWVQQALAALPPTGKEG